VAGLEVPDEVSAAADRPAADVQEVVLPRESPVDEVVELKLSESVPEADVPDAAPVPVRVEVAVVPAGDRALERSLDRDRNGPLEGLDEGLALDRGRLSRSSWRGFAPPAVTRMRRAMRLVWVSFDVMGRD
jgi:hypothetical protein